MIGHKHPAVANRRLLCLESRPILDGLMHGSDDAMQILKIRSAQHSVLDLVGDVRRVATAEELGDSLPAHAAPIRGPRLAVAGDREATAAGLVIFEEDGNRVERRGVLDVQFRDG